ncbi:hypothetical protein GP5015_1646 [gamma proteobacterium HTCC5015]|nr:hypothetical protein GP5015_1646 [gamma proteobacterium HTCC5015]
MGSVWLFVVGISYLPLAVGIALLSVYLAVRSVIAKGNVALLLEGALP